jgi:hypothetical protein
MRSLQLWLCVFGLASSPISSAAGLFSSADAFVALEFGWVKGYRFAQDSADGIGFREVHRTEPGVVAGVRWENGFGGHLSWQRLGEFDVVSQSISPVETQTFITTAQTCSLALAASYTRPLSDKLSLTVLAGLHRWQWTGHSARTDPTWGGILDLRINQRWSTGVGWHRFKLSHGQVSRGSLHLAWHF